MVDFAIELGCVTGSEIVVSGTVVSSTVSITSVVAAFTAFTDTEKSVAISINVHNTQVNAIADFFIYITSHESGD